MVNDIIAGITVRLNAVFGDGYSIYVDDVEQNLKEPCFLVRRVESARSELLGPRKKQNNMFSITYLNESGHADMYDVEQKLFDNLYIIDLKDGTKMLGRNMACRESDGALVFNVNYNTIIEYVPRPGEPMDELETDISTGG